MKMIGIKEVSTMLNVSHKTITRLQQLGKMPKSVRIGRLIRWREDVVLAWINDGCPEVHRIR